MPRFKTNYNSLYFPYPSNPSDEFFAVHEINHHAKTAYHYVPAESPRRAFPADNPFSAAKF